MVGRGSRRRAPDWRTAHLRRNPWLLVWLLAGWLALHFARLWQGELTSSTPVFAQDTSTVPSPRSANNFARRSWFSFAPDPARPRRAWVLLTRAELCAAPPLPGSPPSTPPPPPPPPVGATLFSGCTCTIIAGPGAYPAPLPPPELPRSSDEGLGSRPSTNAVATCAGRPASSQSAGTARKNERWRREN